MYQKYFVNQRSEYDCGVACLSIIFKLNKINISYDDISKKINKTGEMISVYDIVKYSSKHGLKADGYKNVHINDVKTPCIAHILTNNAQHFVVILKVLKDKVLVADPASRIMYVSKSEFLKKYTGIIILFNKNKSLIHDMFKNKTLFFKELLLSIIVVLFSIISSFTLPYATKIINKKRLIAIYIILILIINLLKSIANYVKSRSFTKFQLLIDKQLSLPLINKIINLPHNFYHKHSSGYLISLINDSSYVKELILSFAEVVIINLFFISSICMIMLFMNRLYFLVNAITILLIYMVDRYYLKRITNATYEFQNSNLYFNNYLSSVLTNIIQIKNIGKSNYYSKKISKDYLSILKTSNNISRQIHIKNLLISLITTLASILMIYHLIKLGNLFKLIVVMSLEESLISSLNEIINIMPLYSNYKVAYRRINDLYNTDSFDENNNNKIDIKNICFRHLKYKEIIKDVSFDINKGDWVMVTGSVGSGKSTLFKLLTKQIEYNGRGILINNKSINEYTESELRNTILYVDQKQRLVNDTINTNIFVDTPVDNEVLKLSTLSFDTHLTGDYLIDNSLSNISGGQLNKIIIAQSINCDTDVIIFDETMCNLDRGLERKILTNIKAKYNKTIIVISHNDDNIDLFNKVISINNGKSKIIKGGIS